MEPMVCSISKKNRTRPTNSSISAIRAVFVGGNRRKAPIRKSLEVNLRRDYLPTHRSSISLYVPEHMLLLSLYGHEVFYEKARRILGYAS